MVTRIGLFKREEALANYHAAKALMILCLNETENKCLKLCAQVYDQERHYNSAYLPVVEANKQKIVNTKRRVLEELAKIDRVHKDAPVKALNALVTYGKQLGEEHVLSLFLEIFIGKLKKRWLPIMDASYKKTEPRPLGSVLVLS